MHEYHHHDGNNARKATAAIAAVDGCQITVGAGRGGDNLQQRNCCYAINMLLPL